MAVEVAASLFMAVVVVGTQLFVAAVAVGAQPFVVAKEVGSAVAVTVVVLAQQLVPIEAVPVGVARVVAVLP